MRSGEFFSGAGLLAEGFRRAGLESAWAVEKDEFARQVYAKHHPATELHEDVTNVDPGALDPVDVFAAGFPCQDLSDAGHGAGLAGERSGLYRYVVQAIGLVRPLYTVLENVAALLYRGLGTVLGDLAESGLDAEWDCVSARHCGAAHTRERVFIVAYADSLGRDARGVWTPVFGEGLAAEALRGFQEVRGELVRGAGGRVRVLPLPGVLGMADGPVAGVDQDRLRVIGNGVHPGQGELVGRLLMRHHTKDGPSGIPE